MTVLLYETRRVACAPAFTTKSGQVGKVVYRGAEWEIRSPSPMLLGEYEHTIDDKNRLTLPARFREAFAEGVVSPAAWTAASTPIRARTGSARRIAARPARPVLRKEAREMQRFFFAGATRGRARQAGARDRAAPPCSSTRGWAARSSSRASTTTSRSGIAPPGQSTLTKVEGSAERCCRTSCRQALSTFPSSPRRCASSSPCSRARPSSTARSAQAATRPARRRPRRATGS